MLLSLRPGITALLKMSTEDVEWFNHFAHPEKWTPDACVLWDGAYWREYGGNRNQDHGMFLWARDDDVQMMPAHRLAYLLYRGDFGHLYALHKCPGRTNKHKGRCVNPWHIKPGSRNENLIDMYKDRSIHRQRLSYDNILECFRDRRVLSQHERARKYNVPQRWVAALDNGRVCAQVTAAWWNVVNID